MGEKFFIEVTASISPNSDATRVSVVDSETLELIKPIIQAIKDFESDPDNEYQSGWFDVDMPSEMRGPDERDPHDLYGHIPNLQKFWELVPDGPQGTNGITSVLIYPWIKKEKLF